MHVSQSPPNIPQKEFAGAETTRLTTVVTKKFTHKAKKPAANCENGSIVKLKTTA